MIKKKIIPTEIAVLEYLSENESGSIHEFRQAGGLTSDLGFLVAQRLVERFNMKKEGANVLVARYRITDRGKKVLDDYKSGIETKFEFWRSTRNEIKLS